MASTEVADYTELFCNIRVICGRMDIKLGPTVFSLLHSKMFRIIVTVGCLRGQRCNIHITCGGKGTVPGCLGSRYRVAKNVSASCLGIGQPGSLTNFTNIHFIHARRTRPEGRDENSPARECREPGRPQRKTDQVPERRPNKSMGKIYAIQRHSLPDLRRRALTRPTATVMIVPMSANHMLATRRGINPNCCTPQRAVMSTIVVAIPVIASR